MLGGLWCCDGSCRQEDPLYALVALISIGGNLKSSMMSNSRLPRAAFVHIAAPYKGARTPRTPCCAIHGRERSLDNALQNAFEPRTGPMLNHISQLERAAVSRICPLPDVLASFVWKIA